MVKEPFPLNIQSAQAGERIPDHVLGVFARERLSEALSATHRAGFGPYTRVLDGARVPTDLQLSRAGLEVAAGPTPGPDDLIILVQAPGRVDRVSNLLHELGAQLVARVQRIHARPAAESRDPLAPDIALPQAGNGDVSSPL